MPADRDDDLKREIQAHLDLELSSPARVIDPHRVFSIGFETTGPSGEKGLVGTTSFLSFAKADPSLVVQAVRHAEPLESAGGTVAASPSLIP